MKQVKLVISGNSLGAVKAINDVDVAGKRLKGGIGDLSSVMYSTFAPALAGLGVVAIARQLTDAAIASQKMTNAMLASTGSSAVAAEELAFVRSETERLGLDLLTSADAFTKLTAAAKGTNLEGQATRDIFTAVAGASTALGLRADETEGALRAIQQMMSKGSVQAEELRGQLGERLPGAFNIAARAMGVSTAELGKMLEKGQVISDDFLPKFAAELKKTFEPTEAMTHSAAAEINRFNTALYDLKVAVMDGGGIDALGGLVSAGTSFVNITKDGIRLLAEEKLMLQQVATEIAIMMDSGEGFSRWLLPAGRAELKAELEAAEQMYQYSWNKIQQRYGNAPGIVPPGAFVGPPEPPPKTTTPPEDKGTVAAASAAWIEDRKQRVDAWVADQKLFREAQREEAAQYQLEYFAAIDFENQYRLESSALAREEYFAGLEIEKEMELDRINAGVDAWVAGEERKRANSYASLQQEQQLNSAKMQMTGQFLEAMNTLTGNKNKAIFVAQKLFAIGMATMSAYQASALALAQPPGPPTTTPLAAMAFKIGMMNVAGIAATSIASIAASGRGGGGGGGYGGGTPSSPIVTQPAGGSQIPTGQSITVQIMGNVIGQDKWVEEELVPALRNLGNRNITITA